MTQTTGGPGTGDYGPEVAGRPGSTGADYALDARERPGFHIGSHTLEMELSAAAVLLAAVGAVLIAWTGAHVIGGRDRPGRGGVRVPHPPRRALLASPLRRHGGGTVGVTG
ncbi:MAG: hypothetical protein AUG49_18690 [Catenulispora sp. 13_1_20CM_3_70_7]|nr:MAG: hypothetical protein AUG49_18690 [Catenulispora sp. 13_1_20CM_3_70_7]